MIVKTSDPNSVKPFLKKLFIPEKKSHKGQNGKLLVIGGSSLFHAASIWAAETASHFVDMVHYSSTQENNEIVLGIKKKFQNGIVIAQKNIPSYVEEDDVVLLGPGMVRTEKKMTPEVDYDLKNIEELQEIEHEGIRTYYLTKFLLTNFPEKKFVLDAGALQMMDKNWLKRKKSSILITPHLGEFTTLFGVDLSSATLEEKIKTVKRTAREFSCTILLKNVNDIVSNGEDAHVIEGGNPGLTKGGSGDVLAALAASFFSKNDSTISAVIASYLIKSTADRLSLRKGYWYNTSNIIETIPEVLSEIYGSV